MNKTYAVWCLIIAVVLTAAVGWTSYRLEANYIQHNSYFYDSVYYQYYNARLATRLETDSRWTVAWDEIAHNDRHPLRTVPLVLLYPAALTQPFGHLFTFLPSLAVLLGLMSWLIYRRTQSWLYTAVGTGLFCVLPIFYDVTYGVAVYWLEWQAAAWASAAGLCLLLALHNQTAKQSALHWLIGFAICAAAATLSRYIAALFVLVSCAPLFGWYLWKSQQRLKEVLVPLSIIMVLAGYFLISHFQANAHFYSTYGYALNQTIASAVTFIVAGVVRFVTVPGIFHFLFPIVCLALLIMTVITTYRHWQWQAFCLTAWLGIGPLAFLLLMRTVGAAHPIAYSLVGIVLTAVAPITWPAVRGQIWHWLGVMACAVVVIIFSRQLLLQLTTPDAGIISAQKQFDQSLAAALAQVDDDTVVWNGFFDEYTWIPTMEAYYQTGQLYLPAGQPFFNAHQSAWLGDYPGLTDQEIAERVYAGTNRWVDVAVVLADASHTHTGEWMDNTTSQVVTAYMTDQLAKDSNWQQVFTVDSFYGQLIGYRNMASDQSNYSLLLQASPTVRP